MARRVRAYIGIGANLGDRRANIDCAMRMLGDRFDLDVLAVSSMHETPAQTLGDSEPQPDYLNAAAEIETTLTAAELLAAMLEIERTLGRNRSNEKRWAARLIDLDLLLYADDVVDEPGVVVPHPRMAEREFVLGPLAEVASAARHPTLNRTVSQLLAALPGKHDKGRTISTAVAVLVASMTGLGASTLAHAQDAENVEPSGANGLVEAQNRLRDLASKARESKGNSIEESRITVSRNDVERRSRILLAPSRAALFETIGVAVEDRSFWIWSRSYTGRVLNGVSDDADAWTAALELLPSVPTPMIRFMAGDDLLRSLPPFWEDRSWSEGSVEGDGFKLAAHRGGVVTRIEDQDGEPPLDLVTSGINTARGSIEITIRSQTAPADAIDVPDNLSDRRPVDDIRRLVPLEGPLPIGAAANSLVLLTAQSTAWTTLDEFAEDSDGAVLLFIRTTDPWHTEILPTLRAIARHQWPAGIRLKPVLVLSEDIEDLPATITGLVREWGSDLLWTVSPENSMDLLAPDSTCVAVSLDADATVRSITHIEKRTTDIEPIVRAIEQVFGF